MGTLVALHVTPGDLVAAGALVATVEAMKMHHELRCEHAGRVVSTPVALGATIAVGATVVVIEAAAVQTTATAPAPADAAGSAERSDLADVVARHALGLDAARPEAVARRHARRQRTARENLADLLDPGSLVEYGPLVVAAQRRRRDHDDLIRNTPADGLVGGLGRIDGRPVVVASYDYMVLAGTQGHRNHAKKDRLFELAERLEAPVVVYAEGGGGRPGDTDISGVTGLDCRAFLLLARLSGTVPLVGIASGFCFAGNAAVLGCCDVVIGTLDSNIGMAGPAMIEGGGLGVFDPTEIGPIEVQRRNGVVDLVADDERHATALAKQYLSYFAPAPAPAPAPADSSIVADQTSLRQVVPIDRRRVYDVRAAIDVLFDAGSVLELRRQFGPGMITALARLDGRPVGVIANDPMHLAGAIDSDGSDKAARFMQLCDAHGIALVTLVDTPGMMVGPEVEQTALVRHCSRLFVTGANLTVPVVSVVLRKAYGLGAQAMMASSTKAPLACVAWPTGEFGGMGLEGAVRLGYRNELAACADEAERETLFAELVERLYAHGKALSIAEHFEIDDVIDPADTRAWLTGVLSAVPLGRRGRRPNIDTW